MRILFTTEIIDFALWFRDYIQAAYGETLKIQQTSNNIQIFISENSQNLDNILREKEAFLRNPFDARYQQAVWLSNNHKIPPKYTQKLKLFSIHHILQQNGLFTLLITLLCICVYLLSIIQPILIYSWFSFPENTTQSLEIWRYLSHTLVHLSFSHLLFNLVWWWIFANAIEKICGRYKLMLLYILSSSLSGVVQNWISGPYFFGLSGVVYAVLAYVYIVDYLTHKNQFHLPQGFTSMIIIGILMGFISPIWGIKMGNAAHITGLILGGLLGFGHNHHKNKKLSQCKRKNRSLR